MPPLPAWICRSCAEEFFARIPPREDYAGARRVPDCPGCGDDADVVSVADRDEEYSGPWEVASGCSEGGAATETRPRYREAMRDAGRGRLVR
jgi:hypothetical protein